MTNICDEIEQYILSAIGVEDILYLSRNGLAVYFHVSPSQINYVLNTRFTLDRGFLVQSKRGGGGYLTIVRITGDKTEQVKELLTSEIGEEITYLRVGNILKKLKEEDIVTEREMELILSSVSDRSLNVPLGERNRLRAEIFKNVLQVILKW